MADESYIGKGTIYIGPYADDSKRRPWGNCSRLDLTFETDDKDLLDYTSAGGGKANRIQRITGVNAQITAHDLSALNVADMVQGASVAVAAGTVVDEAHVAYQGGLVRLAFNPDTAVPLVVTSGGGNTTHTLGTDYTETTAGPLIVVGGGIADSTAIEVDYTKKAGDAVEALTATGQEFKLTFVGLNEAQSGRAVVVDIHRWKPGPADTLGFLGDDFAAPNITGECLSDPLIVAAGKSKFFKAEFSDA